MYLGNAQECLNFFRAERGPLANEQLAHLRGFDVPSPLFVDYPERLAKVSQMSARVKRVKSCDISVKGKPIPCWATRLMKTQKDKKGQRVIFLVRTVALTRRQWLFLMQMKASEQALLPKEVSTQFASR